MTRKKWVDKNDIIELDASDNNSKKYKLEAIRNSMVYTKDSK